MESNDSPEIPDRGETSDTPGLPSGDLSGTIMNMLVFLKMEIAKTRKRGRRK